MDSRRTPPHSSEAEKAVLGTLIMFPDRIPESIMQLSPKEFYGEKNRNIYESLISMDLGKSPIDLNTLNDYRGNQDASYLSSLLDGLQKTPKDSFYNYIKSIKETYNLRYILSIFSSLSLDIYNNLNYKQVCESLTEQIGQFINDNKDKQSLSSRIKEWVALREGYFSLTETYKDLRILTPQEKNASWQAIHRLKKEGFIEKYGAKDGVYRRIENEAEVLDWKTADDKEYPIELPFELSKMTYLFPKSIVCIAGNFNAGKTAFCLDTVRLNMDRLKVNYLTSEMGSHKLRQRLRKFENVEFPDGWKFNAIYRASNWADCLKDYPDDINIIDYLQIGENFWAVSDYIDQIFNRLGRGIAIICLQKTLGRDLGRGGDFSAERASLYLSIDPGRLKIVKAKEWRGTENPNGKFKRFKLVQGWRFIPDPDWITEDQEKTLKESEKKMYRT